MIVIFCLGGAGILFDEEASDSEFESEPELDSWSESGWGLLLVDLGFGCDVWNILSDDGRESVSIARSFPFADFFDVTTFDCRSAYLLWTLNEPTHIPRKEINILLEPVLIESSPTRSE